jgi:hypothetical protein
VKGQPYFLSGAHRRACCLLHQVYCAKAVLLVVVSLASVGNDTSVCGRKPPPPLAVNIEVDVEDHGTLL